ncbi:MAG: hypothetical protein DRI01_03165 [Chloroflexi bacterium]|nr:MAG: hypothetical protein DRI01_03165 [Chloroflexota bacterium]
MEEKTPPQPSDNDAAAQTDQRRFQFSGALPDEDRMRYNSAVDNFNRTFVDLWQYMSEWCLRHGDELPQQLRAGIEESLTQALALTSNPNTMGVPIGAYITSLEALPTEQQRQWRTRLSRMDDKLIPDVADSFMYPGLRLIAELWPSKCLGKRHRKRVMAFFATLHDYASIAAVVAQDHIHGLGGLPGDLEKALEMVEEQMPETEEQAIDVIRTHAQDPAKRDFVTQALRAVHELGFDLDDLPPELGLDELKRAAGIPDAEDDPSLRGEIKRERKRLEDAARARMARKREKSRRS